MVQVAVQTVNPNVAAERYEDGRSTTMKRVDRNQIAVIISSVKGHSV